MKSYIINISSTDNSFIGTGFMGVKVSSIEDIKQAMYKYATIIHNGKQCWRTEIKLTFNSVSTLEAFKAEGDRQCEENGFVDLLKAALIYKNDPFIKYKIIFRPSGWIDKDGNEFKLVLLKDDEVIPFNGKLRELLSQIGITF